MFDPNGKHLRTVRIAGSTPWLLDLRFHPHTGKLLVVDYKAAKVFTVDPKTGATSVFMTVTGENPGLDGLTIDAAGNVYVTDAHEGIIWKVGKEGGAGDRLGQEPAPQADEASAPHRRKRSGVQQQADGAVRRQHRARHDREDTGERLTARARHSRRSSSTARAVDRTASSLTSTTTSGSRATSPTRSWCSSRRKAG